MMKRGLLDEFHSLVRRGYDERAPGMLCVGYREFFAFEKHEATLDETVEKIKQDTRNYAKRQITWFRHQEKGREIASGERACAEAVEMVKRFLSL